MNWKENGLHNFLHLKPVKILCWLNSAFYTTAECTDKIGYNFAAIDISRFTDIESFKENIDITIERIKNSRRCEGVEEIFVPGEIEYNNHERQTKEGLFISDGIEGKIRAAMEQTGVETKLEDIAL